MRGSCLKNDSHQIFIKIHVGIERVFFMSFPKKICFKKMLFRMQFTFKIVDFFFNNYLRKRNYSDIICIRNNYFPPVSFFTIHVWFQQLEEYFKGLLDEDSFAFHVRMQMQLAGCIYRTSFFTETLGPADAWIEILYLISRLHSSSS